MSTRRPFGVAAGSVGLAMAWLGGAAIVQLTGATAVLILLTVGAAAAIVAVVSGWRCLGDPEVGRPLAPSLVDQGEEFPLEVPLRTRRAVWIDVRRGSEPIASGWTDATRFRGVATTSRRGRIESLDIAIRSAGPAGLLWWARRIRVEIEPIDVAAAPIGDGRAQVERTTRFGGGERAGRAGAVAGEIDGVRPWREGDSDKFVHWATTLRTGELVVHDRRQDADEQWLVRARPGLPEPDIEAGVVRHALGTGLRAGAVVSVALGDGEPEPIRSVDDAARWSATADLGAQPLSPSRRRWWTSGAAEPEIRSTLRARWWAAGATLLSLVMLAGVLRAGPLTYALIVAGVVTGAWTSGRALVSGAAPSGLARALVGGASLLALVVVLASSGRFDGLLAFLSGPLPQVLIVLVVLHGFESHDRRSVRVGLGVSGVVVMYASAFRVDDQLVWWLAAWGAALWWSLVSLAGVPGPRRPAMRWRTAAAFVSIAAITVGVLMVVPVPRGPAVLALPSLLEGETTSPLPGAVVGAGGEVRDDGSSDSNGGRAPAGAPGGYVGFSETMDTAVRGELGDDVVMRVRAPEPAFWRGQTFSRFDGRRWYADDDIGSLVSGPVVNVPSTDGTIRLAPDIETDEFIQTYYFERDLPNVVFHAERPLQIYIDTDVWVRPDGAIRAATTLPAASVYTVVSQRVRVDAMLLRRQGRIGDRLTAFGRAAFADYLAVPASTSPETIELADRLAVGASSTYDLVRAYEAWLSANVEYDLDAPLPDPGEDAVHEFLFDSRRGFCEQIASALTVMLRTQGVPTRLTTGYIPGERDAVTGVFEVRSSDAHAWVEVWFPETGWQSFDPTAVVPLSADARAGSIGAELVEGVAGFVDRQGDGLALVLTAGALLGGAAWLLVTLRRRRDRGRWGVLQDRFEAVAVRRGARPGASNPSLAAAFGELPTDVASSAADIAERLDRAAFDPTFDDDDRVYRETRHLVGSLPGR